MSTPDRNDDDHELVAYPNERVNPIAFGRVLGRLEAQAEDIKELKETLSDNSKKLDQLLAYHHKQKGAMTILMMVASAVASVTGWFASHWFSK